MSGQSGGTVDCADCQAAPPFFDKARAPLLYKFPVDVALKKLKFSRQIAFAPAFADLLLACLNNEFGDCDALVPVPLHAYRHFRRGFNQADEISRPISKVTGLPEIMTAKRKRATAPQTGLDPNERRKNLSGAFALTEPVYCRRPVIIDDVITTGATCNQLARVLLDAGAKRVGVLTVARA
jgi:ComF family protein